MFVFDSRNKNKSDRKKQFKTYSHDKAFKRLLLNNQEQTFGHPLGLPKILHYI